MRFVCKASVEQTLFLNSVQEHFCTFCNQAEEEEKIRFPRCGEVTDHRPVLIANSEHSRYFYPLGKLMKSLPVIEVVVDYFRKEH